MKKTSVGLVVLTDVPAMGGLCAVLQIRGEFNHEKMGPESWPGACQVTAHGGLKSHESFGTAIVREAYEELGEALGARISNAQAFGKLAELNRLETEEKTAVNYGIRLPAQELFGEPERNPPIPSPMRLSASSGGIRLITRDKVENIVDLKNFDKAIGVWDRTVTAMFSDEKEAVRLAFEKLA